MCVWGGGGVRENNERIIEKIRLIVKIVIVKEIKTNEHYKSKRKKQIRVQQMFLIFILMSIFFIQA